MTRAALLLPFRIAGRELRAGTHGFRLFIACLVLGVAAIAGIGSISAAAINGIAANARAILGSNPMYEVQNLLPDVLYDVTCTPDPSRPDARVADIGQVIGLGALADGRLLDLDEIADMGIAPDFGAGP